MPEPAQQTTVEGFISTAQRFMAGGLSTNSLRTNALLRDDEWKRIDDRVIAVARERLVGVDDLRAAGLTVDIGGLGVLVAEYEKISDMEPAQQSLAGVTEGEEDLPEFTLAGVPIPITHKDFRVNVRHLEASRTRGASIDTSAAELAARLVAEKLEDTLFNGSSISFGSNTLPGYTTFTDRVTGSLNGDWATATGEEIVADMNAMVGAAEAINYFGPFTAYVPQSDMQYLRADYDTSTTTFNKTILQRVLEIDAISAVRPTTKLTDEVLLVQMTSDVIDMPVGSDIVTVEWDSKGGLTQHFKIMAAMAPRLKSDANGSTGIVHYSNP